MNIKPTKSTPVQTISFNDFLLATGAEHKNFINNLHSYLQNQGCTFKIKTAANGYVVSYIHKPSKRTVANYIFRKGQPMLRLYADNIAAYHKVIANLPDEMKATIKAGGNCARLLDPTACNSRCLLGYDFILDGERQTKCRCHNSFAFFLGDVSNPYIREMMECEMQARTGE